ncbi:AbrB/MazE/SpoVT family DNA-binding domain-containing protein [Paenibacillus terrae]|uniref:SpoVT/AbrB-like cell growth regulatory protein n=1 Tax=Paenibacillus terrae (strain HPL-003) TaxID=985665 RepID=G7VYH5_PAETH|nr:AbrB family transcriptional regulator [Paenibacillus terrae]AET58503.1 SpoVT/AbrB-like cell growth regulatory protein [Paenibacillus terrae HPL-003]
MGKVIGMERKITKFGNSLGITMTEAIKQLGLGQGDTVQVEVDHKSGQIIIRKSNKITLPSGLSDDFLENLSQVMDSYDETLKGLKDR